MSRRSAPAHGSHGIPEATVARLPVYLRALYALADRGIAKQVKPEEWRPVCEAAATEFKNQRFLEGARVAIEGVHTLLAKHFPPGKPPREGLPDEAVVL